MKYKLINKTTQEEHLCSKVVINGFDYYYDFKTFPQIGELCYSERTKNIGIFGDFENSYVNECSKIIATNNPNIDLPKVVDEVDIAFETYQSLPIRFKTNSTQWTSGFSFGYNKSKETHPFSEDDMIKFGKWCENLQKDNKEIRRKNPSITTKELLQIWKDQQIKTVYYE